MSYKKTLKLSCKQNLHTTIAQEIACSILSGKFQQEGTIPGEKILCEQFGISRTALREAIKLLTAKGLLKSKPKVGTKVVNRRYWNFLDPQLLTWIKTYQETDTLYQHFSYLRQAVEPEASALAAINATAEQRIELSEIFQKLCQINRNNTPDEWAVVDMQFHRFIFIATNNDFYLPFGNIHKVLLKNYIHYSSTNNGTCHNYHRDIYEAIMAGNADKARLANQNLLSIQTTDGSVSNLASG
ncbi:FadR/GntR family transcriptional regulator [Photobacterium sp. DNB23_23_1]